MIDSNFIETIEILNKNKVGYWICHGTLLGLIRDESLIPWDHDIDIAVWADDISKELIIDIMTKHEYVLKSDGKNGGIDYDYLIFTKSGAREVDFNFYHTSQDMKTAYSEWYVPKSRAISGILDVITSMKINNNNPGLIIKSINQCLAIIGWTLNPIKNYKIFYNFAGYTTPANLLREFKYIELFDIKIRVPNDCHSILEFLYGEDWRTPRENYDWEKESPSTRVSNSRFN